MLLKGRTSVRPFLIKRLFSLFMKEFHFFRVFLPSVRGHNFVIFRGRLLSGLYVIISCCFGRKEKRHGRFFC